MAGAVATGSPLLSASGGRFGNLAESFARLEKDSNGRLGVAVLDTGSGDSVNEALPGDPRDTTSPAAMAGNMRGLLVGNKLSTASREQLIAWLIANKTGDERIRAGLKSGWRVGDKTGSNGDNTANDVAIIWPGHQAPVLVAAYLTVCAGPESKRNAVLAQVGREVSGCIGSV